jgi:ribosomal protein S18 acetylase RimI-like enzyme
MDSLAVDPGFRRHAIGFRLASECLKRMKSRGCVAVSLEVASRNEKALQLFSKLHLRRIRRLKDYYGTNVDGVRFVRRFHTD